MSDERTADLRGLELLFVWLLNFGSSYLPKRPEVFKAAVSDAMNLSAAIVELREFRERREQQEQGCPYIDDHIWDDCDD